jgi:hypothetical protein
MTEGQKAEQAELCQRSDCLAAEGNRPAAEGGQPAAHKRMVEARWGMLGLKAKEGAPTGAEQAERPEPSRIVNWVCG